MEQILHLLIVDRARREALATWHRSRSLLPLLSCAERARAGPLAVRWVRDRGLTGSVVGQWLGRAAPDGRAMDWLVVVDAGRGQEAPAGTRWTPLTDLKGSSLVAYQSWALERAIRADFPAVAGPFGSITWLDDAIQWIKDLAGPACGSITCYRATPHEVVLGVESARGIVYFKGLSPDRAIEATLTSTLSAALPQSFARTVAIEMRRDGCIWWLTDRCAGTPLAVDLTHARALRAATALGTVQRFLIESGKTFEIPDLDLAEAARWALELLRETGFSRALDRGVAILERAQRIGVLPRTWIPLDLDPGNILVDDQSVRFVDLDRSRVGAAPLPLATLLRRLCRRRASSSARAWIDDARRSYAGVWIPSLDFHGLQSDLDILSVLVECRSGWRQLLTAVERGDVHDVVDIAARRTASRLARAVESDPLMECAG